MNVLICIGGYLFGMLLFGTAMDIFGGWDKLKTDFEVATLGTILFPLFVVIFLIVQSFALYNAHVIVPLRTKYKNKNWHKKSDEEYNRAQRVRQ